MYDVYAHITVGFRQSFCMNSKINNLLKTNLTQMSVRKTSQLNIIDFKKVGNL